MLVCWGKSYLFFTNIQCNWILSEIPIIFSLYWKHKIIPFLPKTKKNKNKNKTNKIYKEKKRKEKKRKTQLEKHDVIYSMSTK